MWKDFQSYWVSLLALQWDRHQLLTLISVPNISDAFTKASLQFLLVASKCDAPLNKRQIDPTDTEHLGSFRGVEPMQTTANSAGHKLCFARILNIIIARRNGACRDFPLSVYCSFDFYVPIEFGIFSLLVFYEITSFGYGWFYKIESSSSIPFNLYLPPSKARFLPFRWSFRQFISLRKPGRPQLRDC